MGLGTTSEILRSKSGFVIRGVPARAASPRTTPRPHEVEVRNAGSSFVLVLSDSVKAALNRMDLGSSFEVGGGLFGYRRGLNIFVEDAIPNPAPPKRERSRVFIDSDYMKR